jgi:hypothetical protein
LLRCAPGRLAVILFTRRIGVASDLKLRKNAAA